MTHSRSGRLAALAIALTAALFPGASRAVPTPTPPAVPSPPAIPSPAPATPRWPSPALVATVRTVLVGYYNQEASPLSPYYERAPEYEADKAPARKDPDTLWEFHGGPGTACHAAGTDAAFIDCTGARLARTFGLPVAGGLSLFSAGAGYYANEARAQMAGYYALYHAFARDHDAPQTGAYTPSSTRAPRDYRRYHERMVRAYEAHMRDIAVRMLRDTRADGQFQIDITRSIGAVEASYVRVVEAMEEYGAWASASDRRDALALVSGMNQRIWWEWVMTQASGPRTAGFADLGSQATYQAGVAARPALAGTDAFVYRGVRVPSLRPAALDVGPQSGLWFDADYTLPGEWWCFARFAGGTGDLAKCLAQAGRQSRGGTKSPFGQYYGPTGVSVPCAQRAGSPTTASCGETNLGSIAEEWTWTFVGARAGTFLINQVVAAGDPDAPAGALPVDAYATITQRLGYGISGFSGAAPYHDDLEWPWDPGAAVQAIRTLSAGRHDLEVQDGRYSLGETDTSAASSERRGDTWSIDRQEFPGAMENHAPGPSSLYGTLLLGFVLTDRTSDGLSASLYDQVHRNHVDEFNSWLWLAQASYDRCVGVDDPLDGRCFGLATALWPYPATVQRVPVYTRPEDRTVPLRYRYLWLDRNAAVAESSQAEPDTSCRGRPGVPWRKVYDKAAAGDGGYLIDEGGFGAYNELVQGLGGLMRLLAARDTVPAPSTADASTYAVQRREVIAPWYAEAHRQVEAILALLRDPVAGYGYVPDIENSTCVGLDPGAPTSKMVLTWQQGTGDSVQGTTVRRAMWYSILAMWYAWYDSGWLDVDGGVWR
jgi:hypothetical protein